jgi:GH43 family beta-xylosidase
MIRRPVLIVVATAILLAMGSAVMHVPLRAADVTTTPPPVQPVQRGPDLSAAAPGALWVGADPWVIFHDGHYYHCGSTRGRIEVWKSSRLDEHGERTVVWRPRADGWNRAEIWAPELHRVRGKWYIYYAASAGQNASHRMGVLEAATDDPQGAYVDRGALYTGDDPAARADSRWAIDGTILERGKDLFFIWSGWPRERDEQYLYIAPMSDPVTVCGPRARVCDNATYDWERLGDDPNQRGLHEGPAFLRRGGHIFLVYSCSGSWQPTYKLGMLWAPEDADLLDPKSWRKIDHPVFAASETVFGVGHCSFTTSPDGRQDFIAYHSKIDRREGWQRVVRIQPFRWTEDGFPDFGRPVAPHAVGAGAAGAVRAKE